MAGLTFDEFTVGQVFTHQPSRTVTEADNLLFSALTMNPQPLHIDAEFAKTSHFGQRLVNSIFTLGLVIGLSASEIEALAASVPDNGGVYLVAPRSEISAWRRSSSRSPSSSATPSPR